LAGATTVAQGANTLSFTSSATNGFSVDGSTFSVDAANDRVGIGTTTPNASSALEVSSTTSGFLPPRMTYVQRNAISTPMAGLMVYCTNCGVNGEPQFYNGVSWLNMAGGAGSIPIPTVVVNTSASTTLTFMAHNLGADNSLNQDTPVQGIHGNYYQWGISTIVAGASTSSGAISGWNANAAANGAWADGSKTANDPCPTGYRVPTNAQWNLVYSYNAQTTTGSFTSSETNFASASHFDAGVNKLTLPAAGYRNDSNGALINRGSNGYYWSSTENGSSNANILYFSSINASPSANNRRHGFSVRCVLE
jgi:uncharacterized protein (TIGR02145 family)